ncbi:MAG: right-handed parallel beta-helix repeat-containing protein [Planctomycetota bacterium]|jgi:predicted outer membrane repeat protein
MLLSRRLVIVVAVISSAAQGQTTWYVDDDNCPGPGSGTEGDPYCSIQTAVDSAVDTDEIVVAPGSYSEAINFLGKVIWLHSSDGPEVTTIDGTGNYHVIQCVTGEGSDTILEGFTITGGNANGSSLNGEGGGMRALSSSPTVTDCTFSGNEAGQFGGGLYADSPYGSPTVTNCTFSGNSALEGGGMYTKTGSNQTVTDSAFCGNSPDHSKGPVALDGQIDMSTFCPIPVCPADANGDGEVTVLDFLALLANWGPCP